MEEKKTIGETSIDAKILYENLAKIKVGEQISYRELSNIIKRNVQGNARGNLITARRMALREDRMVFAVIRNEGLKRLDDIGIVEDCFRSVGHVKRTAKKEMKKIVCVNNFNEMPNEAKIQHNAYLSLFGVLAYMTKAGNIKKLEEKVQEENNKLPLMKTLEAFKNGN